MVEAEPVLEILDVVEFGVVERLLFTKFPVDVPMDVPVDVPVIAVVGVSVSVGSTVSLFSVVNVDVSLITEEMFDTLTSKHINIINK